MRIGLIGLGSWGKRLLSEYDQLSDIELRVCDSATDTWMKAGVKYKVYTDYKTLIEKSDAVHIATPNKTHYDIAKHALEQGVDVLVEKPMTITHDEAKDLVGMSQDLDRILAVGHIFRYNNALRNIRYLLNENYFGRVYGIDFVWTTLMDSPQETNIVYDLMPHIYDMCNFLLEEEPLLDAINCSGSICRRHKYEEHVAVTARYKRDILMTSKISWIAPPKTRQISIYGSKKSAVIQAVSQKVDIFDGEKCENLSGFEPNNAMQDEILAFINAVKYRDSLSNSGAVGAKVMKYIEATQKSLTRNR